MTSEKCKSIAQGIANGLHLNPVIIHQDLKPLNIMVSKVNAMVYVYTIVILPGR